MMVSKEDGECDLLCPRCGTGEMSSRGVRTFAADGAEAQTPRATDDHSDIDFALEEGASIEVDFVCAAGHASTLLMAHKNGELIHGWTTGATRQEQPQ